MDILKPLNLFRKLILKYSIVTINSALFHLQKDFFYDGGICLVDFIGKHETLQNDFKKVCSKCNIETDLPHLNASRKKKDHYVKYYSPNSIELISQAFKEDIELFDYRIPTLTNL